MTGESRPVEMTVDEAANYLNVSSEYLLRLLDSGDIPHHTVGTKQLIQFDELAEYRLIRDARRNALLTELAQDAQELGFYKQEPR